MTHDLKCWPEYFEPLLDGRKTFEIRKNDRPFAVGDTLYLKECNPNFSGRRLTGRASQCSYAGTTPVATVYARSRI